MSTIEILHTNKSDVLLVEPDIERDAALGVQWLEGEWGRATLDSMGVSVKTISPRHWSMSVNGSRILSRDKTSLIG